MLKEQKLVVEDLLCDTQQRNDICNKHQNNINKNDEFIAKNFEEISKVREDMLNELSNVRHTELKEKESLRKIENKKKNKKIINLSNYAFESVVNESSDKCI